jgi:hypothetical protein
MMPAVINSQRGAALVAVLLVVQVSLLCLSSDAGGYAAISVFCTGPASSTLGPLFGLLHLLFFGLIVVGALSLRFAGLRLLYIGLLAAGLLMLPVQAVLVRNGVLSCDSP